MSLSASRANGYSDSATNDDLAATKRDLERSIDLLRADINAKFADMKRQFMLLHWMSREIGRAHV